MKTSNSWDKCALRSVPHDLRTHIWKKHHQKKCAYLRTLNRMEFTVCTNAGRKILRGAGLNNLDLSFFKNTYVVEKVNLQFRAEFFNFLNHTQFGPYRGVTFSILPTSSFGAHQATQQDARVLQLALKVIF